MIKLDNDCNNTTDRWIRCSGITRKLTQLAGMIDDLLVVGHTTCKRLPFLREKLVRCGGLIDNSCHHLSDRQMNSAIYFVQRFCEL
jgi:hypothetical protein